MRLVRQSIGQIDGSKGRVIPCAAMRRVAAPLCFALAACAGAPRAVAPTPTPTTVLRITVVYPKTTDVVQARDSAFLFGSAGRGDAVLTVNGTPVAVRPNGAWIAWLPLPDDTIAPFRIVATAAGDSQIVEFKARVAPRFHPPPDRGVWVDTMSFAPAGMLALPPGEGVRLAVRAAPGATVRLRTPAGTVVPLVRDPLPGEPAWGERAFGTEPAGLRVPASPDRYVGWLPAQWLCADSASAVGRGCALLEVVAAGDTVRSVWPLRVTLLDPARPVVVALDDDTARTGTTDSSTAGRAVPGGTYNWFFPTGTTAVMSGRWNDQVRLQLSRSAVAWVNAADVVPLPEGTPPPGGAVGSVRLTPESGSVVLRVPLPTRVPYLVTEDERSVTLRLYGVASNVNWMQYGVTDALVRRMNYAQPAADEVTIALDPGHPPAGSTGPTGLRESVVTLAVALKTKTLLEQAGAQVLLTRTDSLPMDLYPRTRFAEQHGADVLVSIHANALPDGVNPFTTNGTTVYYFQPRSADLARALDRALVAELGLRDIGMGRGDYALARPTWMPAALTEAAFIIIPEQEALLASEDGQWRYARGVAAGIEAFLRERAR